MIRQIQLSSSVYIVSLQIMAEKHILRISVEIKSVRLTVRFPCRLAFELRTDRVRQESEMRHDLVGGDCKPREKIELEMQVLYDSHRRQYEDQRVTLMVKMISNSGTIPAGNVSFSPFGKEALQKSQVSASLEKCPDKSASIVFTHCYQISKFEDSPRSILLRDNSLKQKEELHHAKSGINFINHNVRNRIDRVQSTYLTTTPMKKIENKNQVFDTFQKSYVQQRISREELNGSQILYMANFEEQNTVEPVERAELHKEVARLRAEVKLFKGDDYGQKQRRLKEECNALTNQIDRARERIRQFQRQQRSIALNQKESKDQIERLKVKLSNLESTKNQLQLQLYSKEKLVKEIQSQYKRLQTSNNDLQCQNSNLHKRIEQRQQTNKQQLKRQQQKISNLQSQKQKLLFSNNELLHEIEKIEKKNQITLKQKQKKYVEEKHKVTKINQEIERQLEQLKKQLLEKEKSGQQVMETMRLISEAQNSGRQKITGLTLEVLSLRLNLKKQEERNAQNEGSLQLLKNAQSERTFLKKKNNEMLNQLSKSNEKNERYLGEMNNAYEKIKSLEDCITERTRQRDALTAKISSLKTISDAMKDQGQNLRRNMQESSINNFALNQKFNDLKNRYDKDQSQWKLLQNRYQKEMLGLSKRCELEMSESQDQREVISKQKEQIYQLTKKLGGLNQENLDLNSSLIALRDLLKKSEENMREKESSLDMMSSRILDLEKREKSQMAQIKNQNEELFVASKNIKTLETEFFLAKERYRQQETKGQEQRQDDDQRLKEREKIIAKQYQELVSLNLFLASLQSEIKTCKNNLQMKSTQNQEMRESIQRQHKDLTLRDIKIKQKTQEIKILQEKYQLVLQSEENFRVKAEEYHQSFEKTKKQWKQFKCSTEKALSQFLTEISKENLSPILNLLEFPDETLSAMLNDAFKKISSIVTKSNIKIEQITQQKYLFQEEILSLKEALQALQKQCMAKLAQSSVSQSATQNRLKSEIEELESKILALQEQKLINLHEIQKNNNQLQQKEEAILQLRKEINQAGQIIQSQSAEIKNSEDIILNLKSAGIKVKTSFEGQQMQLFQQKDAAIDELKAANDQLQKRISQIQKNLKEKQELIKKYEANLIQSDYSCQINKQKVTELQSKLNSSRLEKQDINKQVNSLQKELKLLATALSESKLSQESQKIKISQFQSQLTLIYSQLSTAEVEGEKLRGEIVFMKNIIEESQRKLAERQEKEKIILQRETKESFKQKQTIIELNSLLELNDFQLSQQQAEIAQLTEQKAILNQQLIKKKCQITKLQEEINKYANSKLAMDQTIQTLKNEKNQSIAETKRLKEMKSVLQNQLNLLQSQVEVLEEKDREREKLKQELESMEYEVLKSKKLQGVQSGAQINRYTRTNMDERKKIRELQHGLEKKYVDSGIERKNISVDFERERKMLIQQNNKLRGILQLHNSQAERRDRRLSSQGQKLSPRHYSRGR